MERMRVVREYESCDGLPTDVWWCGWNLVWLGRERLGDASLRRFMSLRESVCKTESLTLDMKTTKTMLNAKTMYDATLRWKEKTGAIAL